MPIRRTGMWESNAMTIVTPVMNRCEGMALGMIVAMIISPLLYGTLLADEPYVEREIEDWERSHWSFEPPEAVAAPTHRFSEWRANPIDDFIAAELEQAELAPQPAADPHVLLRRVSFDLTGLPPTPEEIERFERDPSDAAYRKLVDERLDSPRYGERWAQHWLDLARFAETDGFEHDKVRPEAWKYRDWVIEALNSDMPYDEFLRQQIAGDELYPGDEPALTATRFCLSGPDMPDINSLDERRHALLNEMTATVGEVVLGLQLGCAQCHDHKYDPITQADFYRLRAVFAPAVKLKKNQSVSTFDEVFPYEETSHVMLRGDFRAPGPKIDPGVLRVVSRETDFQPEPRNSTAGLRTALAEWLTQRDNALTARVIVNRVWQHHFGTGLVSTPSDFGVMGAQPANGPLLDWLAVWFVDNGWSLKKLHRLIMTSSTYRQRSFLPDDASDEQRAAWQTAATADPQVKPLWRYPRWRLEGEAIRDAMLAAAGELNLKMGGPSVRPPLPQELVGTLLKNQWNVTEDESEHTRRSIYVFARRNLRYPIFEVFDRPSANASCPRRNVSTTAPQSLHLLNSEFSLSTARQLAERVAGTHADRDSQIEAAFLRTLGRRPVAVEREEIAQFMDSPEFEGREALVHLCLSLFNSNEFVTID